MVEFGVLSKWIFVWWDVVWVYQVTQGMWWVPVDVFWRHRCLGPRRCYVTTTSAQTWRLQCTRCWDLPGHIWDYTARLTCAIYQNFGVAMQSYPNFWRWVPLPGKELVEASPDKRSWQGFLAPTLHTRWTNIHTLHYYLHCSTTYIALFMIQTQREHNLWGLRIDV